MIVCCIFFWHFWAYSSYFVFCLDKYTFLHFESLNSSILFHTRYIPMHTCCLKYDFLFFWMLCRLFYFNSYVLVSIRVNPALSMDTVVFFCSTFVTNRHIGFYRWEEGGVRGNKTLNERHTHTQKNSFIGFTLCMCFLIKYLK